MADLPIWSTYDLDNGGYSMNTCRFNSLHIGSLVFLI